MLINADYIQLLRRHIANGPRGNAISTTFRHLDRSSYWRSECERAKETLKSAEGENAELQRQIAALKAKQEVAKAASPSKKRKKPDEDVVPVPRSPKRSKQENPTEKSISNLSETLHEFEFAALGEVCKSTAILYPAWQLN